MRKSFPFLFTVCSDWAEEKRMMGDSDCTNDMDEDLPVFTFLQPTGRSTLMCHRSPEKADAGGCELSVSSSLEVAGAERAASVTLISSDSDDDELYVPLAQRLKDRQNSLISISSAVHHGKGAELCLPSKPTSLHQVKQTSQAESDDVLSILSSTQKQRTKRTVEEIQDSREEAVRSRQFRDTQQQEKETLRREQERQKAERRALAEAARARRPEECIKHMVVAVDPGEEKTGLCSCVNNDQRMPLLRGSNVSVSAALLQVEGGGALLAAVQALGCSCVIEKQVLPRSVSWTRTGPSVQVLNECKSQSQKSEDAV